MSDNVTVDNERLTRVESDLEHTKDDVHEIKTDIREIKDSGKAVEMAVIELAEIARTNQRIFPRLEKLEDKVDKNTARLTMWAGGLTVLSLAFAKYGHLLITP